MPFHLLEYAHDSHGILPTAFPPDKRGQRDRRTYSKSADQLPAQDGPIRLEQSSLQQGPLRHPDFIQWSGDGAPFGAFLVVSPRVHELFQLANLPAHTVHPANVRWPRTSSGKKARPADYFVYAFGREEMLDSFNLNQTSLTCTVTLISERAANSHELAPGSVDSAAVAWEQARARAGEKRPLVVPTALTGDFDDNFRVVPDFESAHFPMRLTDVDLVFLDGWFTPWVSDALREALEAMEITGMKVVDSWDETRITSECDAERASSMLTFANENAGAPEVDARFLERLKRRNMILARRDRVLAERGKPSDEPVAALEERLDVKFPREYGELLRAGELPTDGRFRFYGPNELKTLEDIDPDWSKKSAPEAVRALLVAVDDHGDFLGYLLEKDSETQLSSQLTRFHHETGKLSRSRFKLRFPD